MDSLPDEIIAVIINFNVPILIMCAKRYKEILENVDCYYLVKTYKKVCENYRNFYYWGERGEDHTFICYNKFTIWRLSILEHHPVIVKIDPFIGVIIILKSYKPIQMLKLDDIINRHRKGKLKIYSITLGLDSEGKEKIYKWYTAYYGCKRQKISDNVLLEFFQKYETELIAYVFNLTNWRLADFVDLSTII